MMFAMKIERFDRTVERSTINPSVAGSIHGMYGLINLRTIKVVAFNVIKEGLGYF